MIEAPTIDNAVVTQSRFFVSDFNTAIIDGPLKIYFQEAFESQALKIYFRLQELCESSGFSLQNIDTHGKSVFLMVYPSNDTLKNIFDVASEQVGVEEFSGDLVLGISGVAQTDHTDFLFDHLKGTVV